MALIEFAEIGTRFKDTKSLLRAAEAICPKLNDTLPLRLTLRTSSSPTLVGSVVRMCQSPKQDISVDGYLPYDKKSVDVWVSYFLKHRQQISWTIQFQHKVSELHTPPNFFIFNQREFALKLSTSRKDYIKSIIAELQQEMGSTEDILSQLEKSNSFESSDIKILLDSTSKDWTLTLTGLEDFLEKLIPKFVNYVEPAQMSFYVRNIQKGNESLANFIEAQDCNTKFTSETTLDYRFIKELSYTNPNSTIEIFLPDGLAIWLPQKDMVLYGFWEDINKRKKEYEKKLYSHGFPIENLDDD